MTDENTTEFETTDEETERADEPTPEGDEPGQFPEDVTEDPVGDGDV